VSAKAAMAMPGHDLVAAGRYLLIITDTPPCLG
jgi:hypothetical protein